MDIVSKHSFGVTRRAGLAAAAGAIFSLAAGPVLGQQAAKMEDLMVAGPLGDRPLGAADAPVTVIEYASLTCVHCATFHADGFQFLKQRYIDSGKVRYILREFPLDPLATAGFMLAHCAGDNRYHAMVDLLFAQQRGWAFSEKPVDALLALARQTGFSQESFETCLRNQQIYDGVNAVRQRGTEKFGVNSTPTFFINGAMHRGALSRADLERIIEPLLKS